MAQWPVDEWRIIFRNSSLFPCFFYYSLRKGSSLPLLLFPNYSFHFYSPIYNLLRPGLCCCFIRAVLQPKRLHYTAIYCVRSTGPIAMGLEASLINETELESTLFSFDIVYSKEPHRRLDLFGEHEVPRDSIEKTTTLWRRMVHFLHKNDFYVCVTMISKCQETWQGQIWLILLVNRATK